MAGRLDRMGSVHVSTHSLYHVSVADVAACDLHMTHQRISVRCVNTRGSRKWDTQVAGTCGSRVHLQLGLGEKQTLRWRTRRMGREET